MLIEEYFRQVQATVDSVPIVQTSSVTYDSRGSFEGYICGELYLIDSSTLHIRETRVVER